MLRVVLIDDEYYFRNRLKNAIPWEEHGFTVAGDANNGQTALDMMLELQPDIAIVDINMPIYNGIQLITMLREKGLSCRYIILSGYDDFAFAQQAIRLGVSEYILKPVKNELLLESLCRLRGEIESAATADERYRQLEQRYHNFLRNSFFRDLVNCNLPIHFEKLYDPRFLPERILEYGAYCVAVFQPASDAPMGGDVLRRCRELLPDDGIAVFLDDGSRLCVLGDSADRQVFRRRLEGVSAALERDGVPVRRGIGRSHDSIHGVHLSYSEARIALGRARDENRAAVQYGVGTEPGPLGEDTVVRLRQKILAGDTVAVTRLLGSVYDRLEAEGAVRDLAVLRTLELVGVLTSALSDSIRQPFSVLNLDAGILDTLAGMQELTRLRDWVISIYQLGMRKAAEGRDDYCDVTRKVQAYIDTHYSDTGLSIAAISQGLYLNYSYICYCFKRDKKVTINDYITTVRIERAKELFAARHGNVAFVAEQVGYDNPGYFSKCFKKAVGLPPSEYIRAICPL